MDIPSIGAIGCGAMAMDLLRRCVKMRRARVAVVMDPNREAVTSAAHEFNSQIAETAEELCGHADVNCVLIGSPPALHREHVLLAAAAQKPIFCEKPLAVNVAQCDEMISACRAAGSLLFVGHVLRLFPLYQLSLDLIRQGKIGEPKAVSIARTGYGTLFHIGWRTKRAMTGGLLFEVNVHEFDIMRAILGKPVDVYARLDNLLGKMDFEDQGFVIVSFEGGGTGCLHTSLTSPVGEYRVHVQGTKGNLVHGGFGGTLKWKDIEDNEGEIRKEDLIASDPYDRELDSWLDSITLGTKPLFTGEDGRENVAIAEAAYRSAELGRPVRIAEL